MGLPEYSESISNSSILFTDSVFNFFNNKTNFSDQFEKYTKESFIILTTISIVCQIPN